MRTPLVKFQMATFAVGIIIEDYIFNPNFLNNSFVDRIIAFCNTICITIEIHD